MFYEMGRDCERLRCLYSIHMYIHMYIYTYICIYIYVYIYIYTYMPLSLEVYICTYHKIYIPYIYNHIVYIYAYVYVGDSGVCRNCTNALGQLQIKVCSEAYFPSFA